MSVAPPVQRKKFQINCYQTACATIKKSQYDLPCFGIRLAICLSVPRLEYRIAKKREPAMRIELQCTSCLNHFVAPADANGDAVREQMLNEDAWYNLGDGQTFEDMIFATLMDNGAIACSHCGEPAMVSEESISQLAMEMLSGF